MLMSARRMRGLGQTTRLRVLGIVFLLVIALLLGLAVATYQQVFVPEVPVTLQADSVGNQLNTGADVKLRGVVVGRVRGVTSNGEVATVRLAIDPARVGEIPRNVTARLLPKTLFGERFVDLVPPGRPARPLRAGDVIPQDRTQAGIAVERVLDDLLPLLRTVQPVRLNATLGAVSTALEGRGAKLGANLVRVKDYVARLNAHLPTLTGDISQLAQVTSLYSDVAPSLLRMLDNTSAISRTLVQQRDQLARLFGSTIIMSSTARQVLAENERRLIGVAATSRPTLELLARYSPEFPCLLNGISDWVDHIDQAFKSGTSRPALHITLEIVKPRRPYLPNQDEPYYGETAGPNCWGLPHPDVPAGSPKLNDGTRDHGQILPRPVPPALTLDPAANLAGNRIERQLVGGLVAPVMGVASDQVPDLATLLFGPMARGTAVTLS